MRPRQQKRQTRQSPTRLGDLKSGVQRSVYAGLKDPQLPAGLVSLG
jgi:hypothetical protein